MRDTRPLCAAARPSKASAATTADCGIAHHTGAWSLSFGAWRVARLVADGAGGDTSRGTGRSGSASLSWSEPSTGVADPVESKPALGGLMTWAFRYRRTCALWLMS